MLLSNPAEPFREKILIARGGDRRNISRVHVDLLAHIFVRTEERSVNRFGDRVSRVAEAAV